MRHNATFLVALFAPLAGVLLYFWLIGLFETFDLIMLGSIAGLVTISWIVAIIVTFTVGLPLGWGAIYVLRRLQSESFLAYLMLSAGLAIGLALIIRDAAMGAGFVLTAAILAGTYWFGVAKERVEKYVA